MGLFKCFASRPALIEDDLQNIDHVADSRPVQELAHQTTQTDDELLGNVLAGRETWNMNGSVVDSPAKIEVVDIGQHIAVAQAKGMDGRMSARELKRLHSGANGRLVDNTQAHEPEIWLKQQEEIEKAARRVFLEYARFGTRDKKAKSLDVYRFMKLIRECSLMTSQDSAAAVDLIFCKGDTFCAVCKDSPPRPPLPDAAALERDPSHRSKHHIMYSKCKHLKGSRMDYAGFRHALHHIAELLSVPEPDVWRAVAVSRGPLVNAVTLPRFVRLHDEASPDADKTSTESDKPVGEGRVVERAPGTYPKGMVKPTGAASSTSGFAPMAGARPGSPCFAASGPA